MTGKFVQPNYATQAQSGAQYPTNIDNATAIFARLANAFHASEQDVPDMTVRVDVGMVFDGVTLTEVAAQNTGTITAPVTNPRIDRVVIDQSTGVVSVVIGTEGASPTAPTIPYGKLPIAQALLQISTTQITNSLITDERASLTPIGVIHRDATPVSFVNDNGLKTMYSFTVTGGTIGSARGIRFRFMGKVFNNTGVNRTYSVSLVYLATTVAKTTLTLPTSSAERPLYIEGDIVPRGAANQQAGRIKAVAYNPVSGSASPIAEAEQAGRIAAVDSTIDQPLALKIQMVIADANLSMGGDYFAAELV